jgi:hypothetical protein
MSEINKLYNIIENDIGIINSRNASTMLFTSIGCHFLNLYQKENPIILKGGKPVDLRKHLMFIRIPGAGKSTLLNLLYDMIPLDLKEEGQVRFENFITEAGFSGTRREFGGTVKEYPGLAKQCDKGFIIVEEFSSILESFSTSHSSSFEQTLLLALDSGKIIKTMATGTIEEETAMTFACGIQPIKMANASSGMMRRFLLEFYLPNIKTMDMIRKKSRKSWTSLHQDKAYDGMELIRNYIDEMKDNILITDFQIEESVFDYFDEFNVPVAIESDIYMQSLFGYNVFKQNIEDGTLIVELDDNIKNLMTIDYESRKLIAFDMQTLLVLMIIDEMIKNDEILPSMINITSIFKYASNYQISFDEIIRALRRLEEIGVLMRKYQGNHKTNTYHITNKTFIDNIIESIEKIQNMVEMKG